MSKAEFIQFLYWKEEYTTITYTEDNDEWYYNHFGSNDTFGSPEALLEYWLTEVK